MNRKAGVTIEQIAKEFGVHPMTLQEWLLKARDKAGAARMESRAGTTELQEAQKRIRLLEKENAVLRHAAAYLSQANLLATDARRSLPDKSHEP